jgi:hypothetical protein
MPGRRKIHQHDVRFLLPDTVASASLPSPVWRDDFQAGLALDERGHAFAERGVVVHKHDPDGNYFFQSSSR